MGKNEFALKLCAGLVLLVMAMSVFGGAVSGASFDTRSISVYLYDPDKEPLPRNINIYVYSDPPYRTNNYPWVTRRAGGTSIFVEKGTHTFTPREEGWSFTPPSITITCDYVDGYMTCNTHSIIFVGAKTPNAQFTHSPRRECVGEPITFDPTLSHSYYPTRKIVSYKWDFGDKTTFSNDKFPTHTYFSEGFYTVTLTVTDDMGVSGTITKRFHPVVAIAPTANFSYSPEKPWVGQNIRFNASLSSDDGTIEYYNWTFDDGTEEKGGTCNMIVVHNYSSARDYEVTLNVTDNDGLCNETKKTITVVDVPTPVLEIPALFNKIHPYKNATGGNAPVFQRGVENPEFKITDLTATKPSNVELVIEISEPKAGGVYASVKNITIPDLDWAATVQCEWDWSDNSVPRAILNIPVGIYKAKAKLINTSDDSELTSSDEKEFYVIFDWDNNRLNFIITDFAYVRNIYPSYLGFKGETNFGLHQYDHRIWGVSLDEVNGQVTMQNALDRIMDKVDAQITYNGNINHEDTIPLLTPSVHGNCIDKSSLMIAYARAIGIPARSISASGTDKYQHQWVEASVNSNWYHYDPTDMESSYGQYGSDYYAATLGTAFQPIDGRWKHKGYWVVTSQTSPGVNLQNVYKKYTYVAEIEDSPASPAWGKTDYNYGDSVKVEITVKNTGAIDICPPFIMNPYVKVYLDPGVFSNGNLVGDQPVLTRAEWQAGGLTTSAGALSQKTLTFNFNLPDPVGPNCIWELCSDEDIFVELYYISSANTVILDDKSFEVPGTCISFIPTVIVDDASYRLEDKTMMKADNTPDMYWSERNYVLDAAVVNMYTEAENDENYTKAIVSIGNPDENEHQFTFQIPLYGRGNAVYIPSMGSVITDTSNMDAKTDYLIFYNQSDYNYVSVYEFSNEAVVERVKFFEDNGIKGVNVTTSWNVKLAGSSSNDLSIYFSRREPIMANSNLDFSEIYTTFAKEIVDNGDSLMNLKLSAPEDVRVAETMPVTVTVFNNGVVEETMGLFVNVSKTPRYSRTPKILYTDTASISVSPNTAKTISYPVYITKDTAATIWDISVDTDKEIGATATFAVNDAFVLDCTQDLEVVHNEVFSFNATISNTWDTTVHDVKAALHLFGSFSTLELVEQQIGDLLPNERKTISWRLNATYVGDLPIEVLVTSDDGGSEGVSATITSQTVPDEKTIYVDDDFTDDPANHRWNTIQEGIMDANDGDTVLVYTGTYNETVVLNMTLTLIGEGLPTIDASGTGNAITITADNCIVKGFSCVNAHPSPYAGIRVESNNNVIEDNTCNNNDIGIILVTSTENIIAHNTAKNNDKNGIYLQDSNNNRITDNTASNSVNYHGISLESSNNNEIRDNRANYNHYQGIRLRTSKENIIANNAVENNGDYGIALWTSDANMVANNMANNNGEIGILLSASQNNEIANNTANSNNIYGIRLHSHSDNNILTNNIANSNNKVGIICWTSSGNILTYNKLNSNKCGLGLYNYSTDNILANNTATANSYGISVVRSSNNNIYLNNFVDNTDNAYSYNSNNIWRSASKLTHTYNSKSYWNYLGNYWSDYRGSDTDGDGIGDSSYSIDGDEDEHPLMKPWENYFAL